MRDLKSGSHQFSPCADWVRRGAVAYLLLQGGGGLAWWVMLLGWPGTRSLFMATGAPEATLLALGPPDLLLYVGGSLLGALGLWTKRGWAFPVLCTHAGAAVYAASYCLTLWWLDSGTWRGGVAMLPSLVVVPLIAWRFRPRGSLPC